MKIYLEPDLENQKLPCKSCRHKHFEQRFGEDSFGRYTEITNCSTYCEVLRKYELNFQ